jgi:hypothetical protein
MNLASTKQTDEKQLSEFHSALGIELSLLQASASGTIYESSSRVTIYLSSLSSGLVAIGFASSSHHALEALGFTVLPTVFVLGLFTIVRLIDTSIANIISQRRMERIRAYYSGLSPDGPQYFETDDSVTGTHGVRYGRLSFFFTMASMVIVVNSVLGGATISLFCVLTGNTIGSIGVGIGVVAGLLILGLSLVYEDRRLTPIVRKL